MNTLYSTIHKFRYIFYFFTIVIAIISLAPKASLYYALENIVAKQKVYINGETTNSFLLSFNINNANIYYEDIKIAKIQNISLLSLLFFNSIDIKNIKITRHLEQFVPNKLDNIQISYHIISPIKINISSSGSLGDLKGHIDLLDKKLLINFSPSKIIKTKYNKILSFMKQEKGVYKYEYKFK